MKPFPVSSPTSRFLRWPVVSLALACLVFSPTGCKTSKDRNTGTQPHKDSPKQPASAQNHAQASLPSPHSRVVWLEKSRAISKTLASRLQTELREALATGDPARAVQTCATVAPKIAEELSSAGELKVQRVTLRPRNPKNKADAVDKAVLLNFEKINREDPSARLESLDQLENGHLRYLGGIRIKPLCLSCHGTNVATPLLEAIQKQYPQDRATGYQLGDIRGAFRVEWALPVPKGLDAPNLRAPRVGLVTGGAPSNTDIPKLHKLGFSWVIDLRPEAESGSGESKLVEASGMRFTRLPVRGPLDINFKTANTLRDLLDRTASSRVFLHCATNNRVGALFALMAYQDGASVDTALDRGRALGMTSLTPLVKALLLAAKIRSDRE